MTVDDLVMFDNKKLLDFFKLDQCPDWAEWVAVDRDGTVCYFPPNLLYSLVRMNGHVTHQVIHCNLSR